MNRAVAGASPELLRHVPLFHELDDAELQSVGESMHERNVPAGAVVTTEGGPGDAFFVVDSGEAEVMVDGQPRGTLGPGDHFGEIALLMGSERTATITATSDFRCYALTPSAFRSLVEDNPTIAWKVLESMATRLS
jgi:CRP/FNR family cyclic AMP-dependent transcriptional regulator